MNSQALRETEAITADLPERDKHELIRLLIETRESFAQNGDDREALCADGFLAVIQCRPVSDRHAEAFRSLVSRPSTYHAIPF